MKKRLEAKVFGIVQGVGFRFFVHYYAKKYNITGCVYNDIDGTVSFIGEGNEEDLKKILEYLKQGPTGAEVREVKYEWKNFMNEFNNFSIK